MAEGRLSVKIYYEDTDALGVVYHANFLKYLERGRTELIEATGRPVADWNADGFMFAVYKADLTFLAPARLGDTIEIVTRVTETSIYRMTVAQTVERDGKTLVKAEIQLVCLDHELSLREFPSGVV